MNGTERRGYAVSVCFAHPARANSARPFDLTVGSLDGRSQRLEIDECGEIDLSRLCEHVLELVLLDGLQRVGVGVVGAVVVTDRCFFLSFSTDET